ncbi:hypothetical protein [Streptomyces sp. NPDC003247]|uniref:hypothetical protein n=1 Tax=Streptomyces sp. NPDC003247 TaxID=3364677 RepID=UPI0036B0BE5E
MADPVAALVHSAMSAGAAVLFGTAGQISGAYAAVVVGISASVILSRLGRVRAVSDSVAAGADPDAGIGRTDAPPPAALPAQQSAPASPDGTDGMPTMSRARRIPRAAATAHRD